ncbi:VOC family protein [Dokdonella sp.]|uniref:VOC family protein n=1 Tax=Dokdonella sp. TaxID=2291710 RepID=UPI00260FC4B8|nr:VOC family protein [Dokdonella sp.]
MSDHAADTVSTILPCLSYRDAPAAIEWLCRAFGFTKHAVYAEGDVVHHAELVFGNGMVMLGSVAKPGPWSQYTAQPDEIGGRATQSAYVIVSDCKAHYERAKAAGAAIVLDYEEKDYGGAGYSCRDLEGHLWSFGSYDPWRAQAGS